jgi:hypothetical protein
VRATDANGGGGKPPAGWAVSAATSSSPALLAKGVPSGPDPRPAAALGTSPVPSRGEPVEDSKKEGGEEEEEEQGRLVSEALITAEEEVRCTVEKTLQELQDGGQKNGPGGGGNPAQRLPASLRNRLQDALLRILENLHTPRAKADVVIGAGDDRHAGDGGGGGGGSGEGGEGEVTGVQCKNHGTGAPAGQSPRARQRASQESEGAGVTSGPGAAGATRTNFMTFAQYKKLAGPNATTAQWKQYTGQQVATLSPGPSSAAAIPSHVGAAAALESLAVAATAATSGRSALEDKEVRGCEGGEVAGKGEVCGKQGGDVASQQPLSPAEDSFYKALVALDEQVARLRCAKLAPRVSLQ